MKESLLRVIGRCVIFFNFFYEVRFLYLAVINTKIIIMLGYNVMKVCDFAFIINKKKFKISVSTPPYGRVVYSKKNKSLTFKNEEEHW